MMVAALFVDAKGIYAGLPDVEVWDEARDARTYAGPWPVVAHPPCSRWCRLAGLVEARWGHRKGDDGGCFAAALRAVRAYGGVLEHPAYSDAWATFGLPVPSVAGWQQGLCGGWSCHVEQGRYGHPARKATWLYAYGCKLPSLEWGQDHGLQPNRWRDSSTREAAAMQRPGAVVSWCKNHTAITDDRPRVGKRAAAATPLAFRDVLLTMARSVACRESVA